MITATRIEITDVTLRDGLQMEARVLPLAEKTELFDRLIECPYDRWEVTSFVHPKWMPQFADSDEFSKALVQKLAAKPQTWERLMAFVPNRRGLDRLLVYPYAWATVFVAASETFHKKNVNVTSAETLAELGPMIAAAHAEKRRVRVYVSVAFGCPYEGPIAADRVVTLARTAVELGADEVAISDTIGVAVPAQVTALLALLKKEVPNAVLAVHLHDTYRCGVANAIAAVAAGAHQVDGSTGGVGGCPYAKGATGNVPSEDLLHGFFRAGQEGLRKLAHVQSTVEFLAKSGVPTPGALAAIWARGGTPYLEGR